MARRLDNRPMHATPGSSDAARGLNAMANQILAAAAEAERLKKDKAAGRIRCPERDAADLSAEDWRAQEDERLEGGPKRLASRWGGVKAPPNNRAHSKTSPENPTFNVRAVADVLIEYGYDPTAEMVRILKGTPDPDNPERTNYALDAKSRALLCNELMKYIHPQKKAVEVDQRVAFRGDLDAKLGALLNRLVHQHGGRIPQSIIDAAVFDAVEVEDAEGDDEPFDPRSML